MLDELVAAGSLQLHYIGWGEPAVLGAVVLVHGLGSSAHIWDLVGPELGDDFRVVAVDQRGHGLSEQPDSGYDFPSVVDDLYRFLDAVGVTEPAVIVGHSWGASVVLHFAAQHPARTAGIVLVDGGTSSPGERWAWPEAEVRLRPPELDGMLWTELLERMTERNDMYTDPRVAAVSRSLFAVGVDNRVARRFRIPNHMQVVRALWEQRPAELLAELACPVLILPARRSSDPPEMAAPKAAAVERALAIQPRARVRWFEDSVHDIPLQRPTELATELRALAAELLPARTPR